MITYLNRVAVRERSDGGVSITRFSYDDMQHYGYIDEDAFIDWYMQKRFPGELFTLISDSNLPKDVNGQWDKSSRNEWSLNKVSKNVFVDQTKVAAKNFKKAERNQILAKLGLTEEELKKILLS